ncbi:MAG: FAD-dependent oxidoreductase [Pseudotabrizicola sp.]|uniref:FAD-dependent oxidoreductase n=1 Tax=Pseudotabrizicola sp. TaxID=2939647 RepID=UPI0027232ED8|nr:FAD-dependent oxidoreductase [Pseudotabrizicola sp.]MDO9636940.1 FAD-dependent oxidoreductase [Pseudotabrizicola sp.]
MTEAQTAGRFTFDGQSIPLRPGQSLAAALTEAGLRSFRQTAKGASRGIFCGMGVCQDCLVTIDGVPNRRACMTPAVAGQEIRTQVPFPDLATAAIAQPPTPARIIAPDLLIVGGGAGGLSAAIAARQAGASVIILDERKVGGGQYFKQSAVSAPLDAQQSAGADLLAQALAAGAELIAEVELWGAFDGLLFLAEHKGTALIARPRAAVIATGAYERPEICPGWTLPGVMTTGAAQTLWRSYRTLPGRRVAIVGSGPLNLQVGLELAQGGAEVVMIAERGPAPWMRPMASAALALAGPALALTGLRTLAALRKRSVPVRHGTQLERIDAVDNALRVTLTGGTAPVTADAVLMNAGFEPQNEILRLLGAASTYDPAFGHLRVTRDDTGATTVPGLYAVGDCAGLGGAPAAMAEGRLAGRAAAAALGFGDGYDVFADQRALSRYRRFQRHLWALHDVAPRLPDVPDDTLICRCEEISAGQIRGGLAEQPGHAGTLKRATRVGMGRCQGRYCGPVAARLVAAATGKALEDHSYFAPRVPIKPVTISAILAAEEALKDAL